MRSLIIAVCLGVASGANAVSIVSARPGPVKFEFVDGFGKPIAREARIFVSGQREAEEGLWQLAAGDYRVQAYGVWTCSQSRPIGELTLHVGGAATVDAQTVPFLLGLSAAELRKTEAELNARRLKEQHLVTFTLVRPDGTPAAGADLRCDRLDNTFAVADARGIATCGPVWGGTTARAGDAAFGAVIEVGTGETEVRAVLAPSMEIRALVTGVPEGAPRYELTFNSREAMFSIFTSGKSQLIPAVPAVRTIVCVRAEGVGAGCDVVTPGKGIVDAHLSIGAGGRVGFRARVAGVSIDDPVVYVDRVQYPQRQPLLLAPGRHVLVLNTKSSEARYETVVEVKPGLTTDLGEVELR